MTGAVTQSMPKEDAVPMTGEITQPVTEDVTPPLFNRRSHINIKEEEWIQNADKVLLW